MRAFDEILREEMMHDDHISAMTDSFDIIDSFCNKTELEPDDEEGSD